MKIIAVTVALCLGYSVISLTPVLVRALEKKEAPSDSFFTVSHSEVIGIENIHLKWDLLKTDALPSMSQIQLRVSITSQSKRPLLLNRIIRIGFHQGFELFKLPVYDSKTSNRKVILEPGKTIELKAVGSVMTGLVKPEALVSGLRTLISYTPMGDARGEGSEMVGKETFDYSPDFP
ncbi:hypothetical protein WJU23_09125 [Prosthecobacter sp. SYSU 5D2]|uniref:hypothetical protein n=1 Tax=Prosthecobacter sp. SYSU 5D2 TaxID=3134134 RepID=UPI0031FE70B9